MTRTQAWEASVAIKTQEEYNRIRAELDKFKRDNFTAGGQAFGDAHARYSKRVSALQKQLDEFRPEYSAAKDVPSSSRLYVPQDPISKLDYSTDPNSPFQKALAKIAEETGKKAADAVAKKKFEEYESGYKSEVKAKKDAVKAKENRVKEEATLAQWEKASATAIALGNKPKPKPVFDTPTPSADRFIKRGNRQTTIPTAESDLGWGGHVPISKGRDYTDFGGKTRNSSQRMLLADAVDLFVSDAKTRKQVESILRNGGIQLDSEGITAYDAWNAAITKSNEMAKNGKGMFVTPMQVLQSQYGLSGSSTSTNKQVVDYTSEQLGTIVDSIFQDNLGKDPSAVQRARYIAEFQKAVAKGTVTTTTNSGNNSTSKTVQGFTASKAGADLGATIKSSPEFAVDYKQKQTLEFGDAITKLMQGGM